MLLQKSKKVLEQVILRRCVMQASEVLSVTDIVERLDERQRYSVLKYAEFLLFGMDEAYTEDEEAYWVAEYDKAKAEDDGYRISHEELRAKYGI